MSALPVIIAALNASPNVALLVSDRIYSIIAPQSGALPDAIVTPLSEVEDYTMNGASSFPEARVTVTCRGKTASEATRLGDAVISTLKNLKGPIAGTFATVFRDQIDSTEYTDDGRLFRRIIGFRVRYSN